MILPDPINVLLRRPGFAAVFFALLFCFSVSQVSAQTSRKSPNIVVVLLDDAGFMDFGAYGSDTRTPTIDRLAKNGALFTRYYTSPMCAPSRAMLVTGQDSHAVGMGTLVETLSPQVEGEPGYTLVWEDDQQTVASRLKAAGYQTFMSGKWGIGRVGENLPDRFGFDRSFVLDATGGSNYDNRSYLPHKPTVSWFEDGEPVELPADFYSSRTLADRMIRFIDESNADQPFFAFLSLQALHMPVQAPAEWIDRYNGVFDRGWDVMRAERLERAIEMGLVPRGAALAPSPAHHQAWDGLSDEEKTYWARVMQVNAGMMEAADFHTGRLLDHLESKGLLNNTLVIVTSDNGPESGVVAHEPGVTGAILRLWMAYEGWNASYERLGDPSSLATIGPEWASVAAAPFRHYKFTSSEGGLRVPLVIAGPGIVRPGVQSGRAHVTDLTPTILDAAGVSYDASEFSGRSLLPVLQGQAPGVYGDDEAVGFEASGTAALYRGDWKITRIPPPLGDGLWRLYNLAEDPGESRDLAAERPVLFQEMLNEYNSYTKQVGVVDLSIENSPVKQLQSNMLYKSAVRFWPVILGLALIVSGAAVFGVRGIKKLGRKRSAA